MDKISFYKKDNIMLIDIIDNFINFIENNKNKVQDVSKDTNVEFEITLFRPDIIRTLSRIYALGTEVIKESYIERVITKQNTKFRSRVDLKNIGTYRIKNNMISLKDQNMWEEKRIINKELVKLHNFTYDMKVSLEKEGIKLYSSNYLTEQNSIFLWCVNSLSFIYKNLKISMKEKGMLGAGKDENTNYLKYISNYTSIPSNTSWYIEIEINDFTLYNKEKAEKQLIDCFSFLYGVPNIFCISVIKNNVPTILKTNFITFKDLVQRNEESLLVSVKVDGEKVEFKVKNGICYMILNSIIYIFKTNLPRKIRILGIGEYVKVKGKRIIYPFYIYSINNKLMTNREKSLKLLEGICSGDDIEDEEYESSQITVDEQSHSRKANLQEIYIKNKKFEGNFSSKEELMAAVYQIFTSKYDFETDGIIIMNKDNNIMPKDEKFKLDNTIDILCQVKPNLVLRKNGICIEMDLIKFSDTGEVFKKIYVKNNDEYHFDDILSLVVIKNTKGTVPEYYVTPYCFILEYSLLSDKIVQPRSIKTNNFYYHKYLGNSNDVIIRSEDIHTMNKIPPIETFKELGRSFDVSKIYNISNNDNNLLNADKTKYFIDNSKRTPLSYITSFVKTQAILNSFSPVIKEGPYDRKKNSYLSIDIGRGADIQRYFYVNSSSLTGTDPSENALDECRNRYNKQLQKSRSSMFKLNLHKIYFTDKDYVSTVKTHGTSKYIGIDWNMAIHYCWKLSTRFEITRKIRDLMEDKGRIVITTIDGKRVLDLMEQRSTNELSFNIDDVNIKFVVFKDSENNMINKVFIPTMTSESQDEYIIDIDDLINVFESNKFMLLDYYHFNLISYFQDIFNSLTVVRNERETSRYYFFKNLSSCNIEKGSDLETLCSLYVSLIFEKQ